MAFGRELSYRVGIELGELDRAAGTEVQEHAEVMPANPSAAAQAACITALLVRGAGG